MAGQDKPKFKALLKPQFDEADGAVGLNIVLSLESVELLEGSTIVSFPSIIKHTISEHGIRFIDGKGELPTICKALEGTCLSWTVERQTFGEVKLEYSVLPSSDKTPLGLNRDHGGLLGSGLTLIPIPLTGQLYRNIVEWDLGDAPQGTRAVWTFGEGPAAVERVGPASTLSDSVYMVGPIHSNPPTPVSGSISDYYGFYWFGGLPSNIEVIKDMHHSFFLKICDFFEEMPSASNPYRSFVRNTGSRKSFVGTSFTRSHVFDYDNQIAEAEDYDLVRRLAYEMAHNWLGPPVTAGTDWLYEGIKNCLSIYFPFRNRFRPAHYFQATISMLCTRYYTNPLINVPHEELLKLVPTNEYAKELLLARAWAFIVSMDIRTRWLAVGKIMRPVEDLAIKPFSKRRANGEAHGIEEWIQLVEPLLGDETRERYEDMLSGKVILIDVRLFSGAGTHVLKQIDMEILDFGMDRDSFEEGVVKGLRAGSRAEQSGLKEGDRIVRSSYLWRCVDHFNETMKVVVEREGVETEIEYWPRSFEIAKAWQMIKLDEE
ncbi:hypothetical protein L207DRAFT_514073 [Hyaloscypha variabilis F]|uniref:Peptidase M61 catalytic domain-containing protein n=1 Tax=Hyaloscypha variabilis (strain UAMH 11265 / GT02V1 / F) TaxID=1149755 RepID=A0A2J6RI04_HYAVF|nr:hypothetical protein L207DRAFT_514073 [Hyaloscypha variabilis F]